MDKPLGSIVAFEGHQEIILTQLRLLPISSQILILPSIESYLPSDILEQEDFDATALIRKTHDAAQARNDTAREFLQGSSPTSRRLVFLNGGTSSAQSLCIREIMRNEADGDAMEAESIYNELTQDGLTGLEARGKRYKRRHLLGYSIEQPEDYLFEDPITRAMRAAEALDRLTANLQPSSNLDFTATTTLHERRSSLPLYGYSDSFCDAAPFFMFGTHAHNATDDDCQSSHPPTPSFATAHYDRFCETPPHASQTPVLQTPSCTGEAYGTPVMSPHASEDATPWSDAFSVQGPDVEYGEAAVLDMRGSTRKTAVPKVRSLDRMYPASPKHRDPCFSLELCGLDGAASSRSSKISCGLSSSWAEYVDGPRTVIIGPKRPAVTLTPVPDGNKREPNSLYLDRGTEPDAVAEVETCFEPVLPATEDLVIYFKDEVPDILLDSVISTFKDEYYYPATRKAACPAPTFAESLPGTPQSPTMQIPEWELTTASARQGCFLGAAEDYDPFSYNQPHVPWFPAKKEHNTAVDAERPPTPVRTPRDSTSGEGEGLHVFNIAPYQTAVAVQNSLRAILNVYFPPKSQGYRHFQFSVLPELEGLWKPVFREADPNNPRQNNRKVDLILAIGSQRGVGKEFVSMVTAQLEKLGSKTPGSCRSGRLDFRYLLANVMQAFTAQPLANQTCDNPFANPYLLATLIIPHLETYLAQHPRIRYLLLDFPPEHLPTVLALQRLAGVDLMKVAQVMNSESEVAQPFTQIRGANRSSRAAAAAALPAPSFGSDVMVSNANFLLTSTATAAEIATFITTIHDILIEISPLYSVEEVAHSDAWVGVSTTSAATFIPSYHRRHHPPALQSNFSPYSGSERRPRPTSSHSTRARNPPRLDSPETVSSVSDTIQTPLSTRSKFGRSWKHDEPSVFAFDPAEDSDYDVEERRLLPVYMQKPPRGNSRKALKFLGLA
ncbi:hypothetical protein S7711_02084 [Stachybotrys chartarum IBT 7711]|uniref:Uncharacterized protein n=1 Tax=Stachybotrys chartarum (strain CBS 109288 / IBT 7711) TaxID=1280523 RepID=A0A084AW70_STACB|nr:hypothetical protein S7711_02084 [Stachybotrys chartarum IBT 7711]